MTIGSFISSPHGTKDIREEEVERPKTPARIWPAELEQRHVEGAKLFAHRAAMIADIKLCDKPVIAEIGVAFGDFSRLMLDRFCPARFDAFDTYGMHQWEKTWGGGGMRDALAGKTHSEFYRDRFASEIAEGLVNMIEGDSSAMLSALPDFFYDLIYIDGAHDYEGVRKDAAVAVKKIKANGLLIFNDYIMHDHITDTPYGVVPVVNDLCLNHNWRITHFALQGALFCDVGLRRSA